MIKFYICSDCHEIKEDLKRECILQIDCEETPNLCPNGMLHHVKWHELKPEDLSIHNIT